MGSATSELYDRLITIMVKVLLIVIIFLSILILASCKQIVNEIAFHPDRQNVIPLNRLPGNVEEIFITTADNIKIQSYFIPNEASNKIIIYFHGNAGNIGHRLQDLMQLHSFGINVLGVGYRGYGKSQGKPSEAGIYIDGKSALKHATQNLGFKLENIYLFGRSIGSAVAINTSQNIHINGLILATPLTSGKEWVKTTNLRFVSYLAGKSFDNISKIENVICPLLIIHGSRDHIIPYTMGKSIFTKANTKKQFIKIDGAGHNNLSTKYAKSYWLPIYDFIRHEN
jgi:uncharacterized protein